MPDLFPVLKRDEIDKLVFEVAKNDAAPLMRYSAGTGGAVQHGGGKWFLLRP